MQNPSIKPLPADDTLLLRSASSLGSVYLIVEELVTNSIESTATNVDIFIDAVKGLIMVKDDGCGISILDLQTNIGEWNRSSKGKNNKGQGLAAIRSLAETLEIITKTKEQSIVYSKKMGGLNKICTVSEVSDLNVSLPLQGTIVIVYNLFACLPVRRRSIRWDHELSIIKDWIIKMSLLHHKISWSLTELSKSRSLCQIKSTASVTQSLIDTFGPGVVSKVCQISVAYHNYHLNGFISKPSHEYCLSNKDQQMLFLHDKVLQKGDLVATIINKAFSRFLATQNRSGFNSRHVDLQAESTLKYPFFLLQLKCPSAEDYDVLVEPNKSVVYFRQPAEVEILVVQLLRQLQQQFLPNQAAVVDALEQQYGSSTPQHVGSGISGEATLSNALLFSRSIEHSPSVQRMVLEHALQKTSTATSRRSADSLLSDAFDLSPSFNRRVLSTHGSTPDQSKIVSRLQTVSEQHPTRDHREIVSTRDKEDIFGDSEGIGVTIARIKHQATGRTRNLLFQEGFSYTNPSDGNNEMLFGVDELINEFPTTIATATTTAQNSLPVCQETFTPSTVHMLEKPQLYGVSAADSEQEEITIGDYLISSEERLGRYLFHRQVPTIADQASSMDKSTEMKPPILHIEHRLDRLNQQDPSTRKRSLAEVAQPMLTTGKRSRGDRDLAGDSLYPHIQTVSLSRLTDMSQVACIGQVDRKYIACVIDAAQNSADTIQEMPGSTPQTMLVLLDQHAVDERIHIEMMQKEDSCLGDRHTILLSPPQRLYVDRMTLQTLQEKETLLQCWCFSYHIPAHRQGDHATLDGLDAPYVVDLLSVPMVYGDEVLTADDLLEFCSHIQMQKEMPNSLLSPPAMHRILTSKACRQSLKFGQVLQRQELQQLLALWKETRLPFQCAHGRPSIVPMMNTTVISQAISKYEEALSNVNIHQLL